MARFVSGLAIVISLWTLSAHAQLFTPVATRAFELGFGGAPLNFFSQTPAVNYDSGGSGIAYNVPSPVCIGNSCASGAAAYRADSINFKSSVFNASFPYQLGFVTSPNSYSYTINIATPGPFNLTLWTGSASSGGSWAIFIDNSKVATVLTPNTGSYSTLQSAVSSSFSATTGTHIMRLAWATGDALGQAGDLVAWQGNVATVTGGKTITTFTMVNDTNGTLQAGTPVSFGQAFDYGDVLPGTYPTIRDAQTHLPLAGQQWDEIARWIENGGNKSWRHAVWAAWLPTSVPAGGTYQVEFVSTVGNYSESSHQPLSALCAGNAAHDLKIHLTDIRNQDNTLRDSGDATFRVCNNIANTGRDAPRHFRAGNVYDEYQVSGLFAYTSGNKDPLLYAQCDIDIFTKSSDGVSPGDVKWNCNIHNSWENVASGSAGNTGNPGPAGFPNDPQTIAYVAEVDDGASDVLDWKGLNATLASANSPVVAASSNGCGTDAGAWCMIVPSSLGNNAWYYSQAVRVTCSGGCIGGLTTDQVYFAYPSSSDASNGTVTTGVALFTDPTANSGAVLNGSQGSGSTAFSTVFMHYHWTAIPLLDATGQANWAPIGTTTRQTRKIYPAFTNTEKRYWQSSGLVYPINLAQPPNEFAYAWHQGESGNYDPNGRMNVIGGGGVGDRPDLGSPSQWAAEAFLTGTQLDWDAERLFTLGTSMHGFSTLLNEATGRIPALNNGAPTGPGGNGSGVPYTGLGALQPFTNWSPVGLIGIAPLDANGGYPVDGVFTFGTSIDHMPGFDGFTYMVFGDRLWLDLMQWHGNRSFLQQKVGPGPLLGQGYYRDNNATFTDGNVYHYFGLLIACCQGRGSSWLIRDVSTPAGFGQDPTLAYPDGTFNSERAVFDDMVAENSNYWPLHLKFRDGVGNSNYSTSIWPTFNPVDPNIDIFQEGYAASVAYQVEALLHTPSASTWNSELQRYIEGTIGGQLPGMAATTPGGLPSYWVAGFQTQPAIHNGDGTFGQFGENLGQYTNGTDATDFGWWSNVWGNVLTGGQWSTTTGTPNLADGDTIKLLTPWYNGPNLDQLSGEIWYEVMNVDNTVNPATFFIKCPLGHVVDATCPTPGQPFTGYTRGGVAVTNEFAVEAPKFRFHFDPGPGNGYQDMNYAQYAGSIANGLAVLGYSTPNAQADFASRCGGTGLAQAFCYNIANPSNWIDPTIVVPGLPPAVNGLSGAPPPAPTISGISVAPASFIAQAGNANRTVGTISAGTIGPAFNGQFALASSANCPGTNNSLFTSSGNLLIIGTSDITSPGSQTICIKATDSNFSNSPFFQGLTITGTPSGATTVQVNGTSNPVSVAGSASITATVTNGPGDPRDWLGVFAVGSPSGPNNPASWKYLACNCQTPPGSGVSSGTVTLQVPATTGNYEVRFFLNDNFTVYATSSTVTVTTAPPTINSVAVTPPSFVAQVGNANRTIGPISANTSTGLFSGTFALATSSNCPGTNNNLFVASNTNLVVGASDITTPNVYTLCIKATDANFSNSPFFQALTVSGTTPPIADGTLLPPPPTGFHWVRTFVDDFSVASPNSGTSTGPVTLDTTANTGGLWSLDHFCGTGNFTTYHSPTYGCGLPNASASDTISGGTLTMTLDDSSNNERNVIATGPPSGDSAQGNTFTQRFGYFVYAARVPNCASTEWDLQAFASGSFGPGGTQTANYGQLAWASEKAECNYQHVFPYEIASSGGPSTPISGGDIEAGVNLTSATHQYGVLWTNDSSLHGSVVIYLDGSAATSRYALQSPGWDNGLYFDVYWQGPGTVTSPMQLDFVRAYQLVAGP